MEERKFDPYQFIGFVLIAIILTWMLYRNGQDPVTNNPKTVKEQVNKDQVFSSSKNDSLIQEQKISKYGDLGN